MIEANPLSVTVVRETEGPYTADPLVLHVSYHKDRPNGSIMGPQGVADLFADYLRTSGPETWAIYVDTKHHPIGTFRVAERAPRESDLREIFRAAVVLGAPAFLLVSNDQRSLAPRFLPDLKSKTKFLGILPLDYIVVSPSGHWTSEHERGTL